MKRYFSLLFWGLLLVILDFSLNEFDFLMDGVGYLMIAAGCGGLSQWSPQFSTARILCFVLAVMWLVGFAIPGGLAIGYGLVTTLVDCIFIWKLLGGIADFATERQRLDLAQQAYNRRFAYVGIMVCTPLLAIALANSRNPEPLVFLSVVAMLVLLVMILHLIHRTKVELAS